MINYALDTQGKRLRFLRKLCKRSRKAFAERHNLSLPTVTSWELDIAVISKRMCQKLITAFEEESILVHEEWIKFGNDPQPITQKHLSDKNVSVNYDKFKIDLNQFLNVDKNRIAETLDFDVAPPFLEKHDIVGAEIVEKTSIKNLANKIVLVKSPSEPIFQVAKIASSPHGGLFFTKFSSQDTSENQIIPLTENCTCAQIIWIRKFS